MSIAIVIIIGLAVTLLLLVQLRNEARAQSEQIRDAFGHLCIQVRCSPVGAGSQGINPGLCEPAVTYPIMSTSITCGKESIGKRYQVDLPVPTGDPGLKGTAAEFTVDPEEGCLRLFVRRLEQPVVWVFSEDYRVVRCLIDQLPRKEVNGQTVVDRDNLPKPAFVVKNQDFSFFEDKETRLPLQLGDVIVMGDTIFTVCRERGTGE